MPHKISYRERGQGELLILLHGYGGSVHHWEQIADSLSSYYHVVVPNLSHVYMSTDKLFFTVQIEVIAKFIRETYPGKKVNIAGLSYGGALTWGLSSQYPELIEKTILINPMMIHPMKHFIPKELKFFFSLPFNLTSIYVMLSTPMGKRFLKHAAEIFRNERSQGVTAIDQLKGRKLQFVSHMIHHFSWILRSENWLFWEEKVKNKHTANCCLIFDEEDPLFHKDSYHNFATHIGCKNIVVISEAGHLATKTSPDIISQHILEFLKTTNSVAV